MDRNYYYRILGVRSDATPAQIRDAYNTRIARLSSSDYADEPEYARRKKEQATYAYRVLMGVSPSATKEQKENRFEKLKDRIESREGFDVDDDEPKLKISMPKINFGKKAVKNTGNKTKLTVVGTAITIIIAITSLASAIGGLVSNDYEYEDYYYIEETVDAQDLSLMFDYYNMLDTSTTEANQNNIDWNVGVEEYGVDPLSEDMMDVLSWFSIYDVDGFFTYVTGDKNYYMERDDFDCAVTLIHWINAPSFESIAGATSLYSGEPILSIADYMEFLEEYVYEHV